MYNWKNFYFIHATKNSLPCCRKKIEHEALEESWQNDPPAIFHHAQTCSQSQVRRACWSIVAPNISSPLMCYLYSVTHGFGFLSPCNLDWIYIQFELTSGQVYAIKMEITIMSLISFLKSGWSALQLTFVKHYFYLLRYKNKQTCIHKKMFKQHILKN